jgi:cysteine synthase
VLEDAAKLNLMDEYIAIPDGAGAETAMRLARTQGILTGISGGASMWAALETAKKAPEGSVLCVMLPDTGERYLSTPLFASIEADMNAEELEIAKSTPSHQLCPLPESA